VGRAPFTLTLTDETGATVLRTSDRLRQVAGLLTAPSVVVEHGTTTLSLELGADEDILGFGEQFSRLVKNGQKLRLRSEDACGTGTGMAYKPVPVWHSSRGYTGFVNTGAVLTADVGHSRPSVLSIGVDDPVIDLYVVAGADPATRLTAYTALTGRPDVPQPWAFGYWMGRCRYHTSEEMLEVGRTMRELEVPLDVLHLDPDWLVVDRLNTDFIWNTSRFGDRKQFVADLGDLGIRLSLWELPYLDPASPIFEHAEREGYLVRRTDGSLAGIVKTPTPDGRMRALIDFTNPDARPGVHRPAPARLGPQRMGGLPPLPRPVGWRRGVDGRRDAGHRAGRSLLRDERSGLLEPRHRRVLRARAHARALRPVDPARRAVTADARSRPAPPGTLGVRGRGAAHLPRLGPPALLAPALPVAGRQRVRGERLAGDAAARLPLPR
jgi:hypothetical protein